MPATLSPPRRFPARHRAPPKSDWRTLGKLLPYVWQWRWRVGVALACLVAAKLANIGVPLVLKSLVDALALKPGDPRSVLVVPVAILVGYGLLRLSITLFTELREFLFYPVAARIARRVSLEAFEHLLQLSLRFHLERQTGGVSRDIERGSRSIQSPQLPIYNIRRWSRSDGDRSLGEIRRLVRRHHLRRPGLYIGFTVTVTEGELAFAGR
jgi:ATP-binding cassette subfamily B protein